MDCFWAGRERLGEIGRDWVRLGEFGRGLVESDWARLGEI